MPSATTIQITRIQNIIIWKRYSEERKRFCVKIRVVNELELFHGCSTDPLNISNCEEGFDVRHSRGGREREMLVAKVILGEIFVGRKKTTHSESHL